jgi:three-Cys-motif partner protein
MAVTPQNFGGKWTIEKLNRVKKYLSAYARIMSRQGFRFAYIDAFAGTGYRSLTQAQDAQELMFPELMEKEARGFLEGSARIALQIEPQFDRYIFIEKDEKRFNELGRLKDTFASVADRILVVNTEANTYINDLCLNYKWQRHRAVMFLDPFGMQVTWETVEAIASTRAIDLWYLFPLGVAVNRLLKKDGEINQAIKGSLDRLFGVTDWYDAFYSVTKESDLFGERSVMKKIGSFDVIGDFFVNRLRKAFAGVAENPLPLLNSRRNPLPSLFCCQQSKRRDHCGQDRSGYLDEGMTWGINQRSNGPTQRGTR